MEAATPAGKLPWARTLRSFGQRTEFLSRGCEVYVAESFSLLPAEDDPQWPLNQWVGSGSETQGEVCPEDRPSLREGKAAQPPCAPFAAAASDPSRQDALGWRGDGRGPARVRFSKGALSSHEPVPKETLGFSKQQFVLLWEKETIQEKLLVLHSHADEAMRSDCSLCIPLPIVFPS